MADQGSLFLSLPLEIRLQIYSYLLPSSPDRTFRIRHMLPHTWMRLRCSTDRLPARTIYTIIARNMCRKCQETTYHLMRPHGGGSEAVAAVAVMATCRAVYAETADVLYGGHTFDFGSDIEAAVPFLRDLTPHARSRVGSIALYKTGYCAPFDETDRFEWPALCRYLATEPALRLRRLRLTVEGGKPARWLADPVYGGGDELFGGQGVGSAGAGVGSARLLSARDVELLCFVRNEVLEWVNHLCKLRRLEEVEVVPDLRPCSFPSTSAMIVYVAVSASIDTGIRDYLREKLEVGHASKGSDGLTH